MALKPCAKCGHQISDKARTCPKCGASTHRHNSDETTNNLRSVSVSMSDDSSEVVPTASSSLKLKFPRKLPAFDFNREASNGRWFALIISLSVCFVIAMVVPVFLVPLLLAMVFAASIAATLLFHNGLRQLLQKVNLISSASAFKPAFLDGLKLGSIVTAVFLIGGLLGIGGNDSSENEVATTHKRES